MTKKRLSIETGQYAAFCFSIGAIGPFVTDNTLARFNQNDANGLRFIVDESHLIPHIDPQFLWRDIRSMKRGRHERQQFGWFVGPSADSST